MKETMTIDALREVSTRLSKERISQAQREELGAAYGAQLALLRDATR